MADALASAVLQVAGTLGSQSPSLLLALEQVFLFGPTQAKYSSSTDQNVVAYLSDCRRTCEHHSHLSTFRCALTHDVPLLAIFELSDGN